MKKLVLVCGAPTSEMEAPWNDESYEIWVLGNRCDRYPRYDLIFEIHDDLKEHDPLYAGWLVERHKPIICGENSPLIGMADWVSVFPYAEANQLFGAEYLTSSPAMMLALAMLRGYEYIEVYGVDMAVDDHEYFWQRPCMEAWIGFARGRGHTVILHPSSPVCRSEYVEGRAAGGKPAFGKPPFTQEGFMEVAKRHSDIMAHHRQEILRLQAAIQGHDGCRQAYEQMAKVARAIEAGNEIDTLISTVEPKRALL